MNNECTDRDLLAVEPILYVGGGLPAQVLAAGADGEIADGVFTREAADFVAAGVEEGMALCVWATTASEGAAYEVVGVRSPTQLAVSLLRADRDVPPLSPPDQSGLSFRVQTFVPQIRGVAAALAEKLRQLAEAAGVEFAGFVDSSQLRQVIVYGALAGIFAARAASPAAEVNWIKAEHYRRMFREAQAQLRLAVDADGDGMAEQTRSLGHVTLRRA